MTVRQRSRSCHAAGRACRELAELTRAVRPNECVTLTGSGGCGKTRLALELAARLHRRPLRRRVAWVELASCSDSRRRSAPWRARSTWSSAGVSRCSTRRARVLRARASSLLVLDNAEHVLAPVAAVVGSGRPGVDTSRSCARAASRSAFRARWCGGCRRSARHRSSGSMALAAADLERFDAAQLFVDRARRARRGFAVTDANAAAIAQICMPARRRAAGDRAGRRPRALDAARAHRRAARRSLPTARRRPAHRARPAADPACVGRLERGPARRDRASGVPPPGRVRRRLHRRGGRSGGRRLRRRRPLRRRRGGRPARRQEPRPVRRDRRPLLAARHDPLVRAAAVARLRRDGAGTRTPMPSGARRGSARRGTTTTSPTSTSWWESRLAHRRSGRPGVAELRERARLGRPRQQPVASARHRSRRLLGAAPTGRRLGALRHAGRRARRPATTRVDAGDRRAADGADQRGRRRVRAAARRAPSPGRPSAAIARSAPPPRSGAARRHGDAVRSRATT